MKKEIIRKRLENKGWIIKHDMCGIYVAQNRGYIVRADTLNGLYNIIYNKR